MSIFVCTLDSFFYGLQYSHHLFTHLVVWLVGEYHSELQKYSQDILLTLSRQFPDEGTEAKMQILNLSVKLTLN
ncbi:hypothetical protein EON65_54955, partial [archaeon]